MDRQLVIGQRLRAEVRRPFRQRGDGDDVVADPPSPALRQVCQAPAAQMRLPRFRPPGVVHGDVAVVRQQAYRPLVVRKSIDVAHPDLGLRIAGNALHRASPSGSGYPNTSSSGTLKTRAIWKAISSEGE